MDARETANELYGGITAILHKYNDITTFCGNLADDGYHEVQKFVQEIPGISSFRVESFGSVGGDIDENGKVDPGEMKCEVTYRLADADEDSRCVAIVQWRSKTMNYQLRAFDRAMDGV